MTSRAFLTKKGPEEGRASTLVPRQPFTRQLLFKTLKTIGRLDQLRSARLPVIQAFISATSIGMRLAHETCAQMRRESPEREPSAYRVAALVLGQLPEIVKPLGTNGQRAVMDPFISALWREGTNPNPGRSYMATRYAEQLRQRRQPLTHGFEPMNASPAVF